jgi:monoamine oxidase
MSRVTKVRRASPRAAAEPSCIVIGAGLAGLAAAYYLSSRKWKVTVLEAQSRFGGRVLSHRFAEAPDLVCELGGEWIGANHKAIRRLCARLGLHLEAHSYGFTFWPGGPADRSRVYRPGAWPFTRAAKREFDTFAGRFRRYSELQKRQLDQIDWWTHLLNLKFTEQELLRRDLMDSTDFGESIRMTSAYVAATEYLSGDSTDEMDFKVCGGNDRLTEALVAEIRSRGQAIWDRSPVTGVRQFTRGVQVRVATGRGPFAADYCICTIPARNLGKIHWSPALPAAQRQAADQLQYARIVKTAILYNRRFWKTRYPYGFSTFTGRVSDFCFDSTFAQVGECGILCSYAIGDKADDVAGEPDPSSVMRWITDDMTTIVKPDRQQLIAPIQIASQAWQKDVWTGGAYALYRPGQWFTVRRILQTRHRCVYFAGEHLAEWQGFMEGAVETGEAAAAAVHARVHRSVQRH